MIRETPITVRLVLWVAAGIGVAIVAAIPIVGPVPSLVALGLLATGILLIRLPVAALAVAIVIAPIGAESVPGLGGSVKVIHLAAALAAGGVILAALVGRLRFRVPAVMTFAGIFVGSLFLSTMFSSDPFRSLTTSSTFLLALVLALCASVLVRESQTNLIWLLRVWFVSAMTVIVPGIPGAVTAEQQFGGALVEGRAQGTFAQPNDFGIYCLLALVACTALWAAPGRRIDVYLGALGSLTALIGIAVSFSRGSWLGLTAFVIVACLLSRRLIIPVLIAVTVAIPIFALGISTGTPPFDALSERATAITNPGANPEDDRPLIYAQAIDVFTDNWAVGYGPGTFLSTSYEPGTVFVRRYYLHGHSVPLTVLAEVGLVGFVSLLAFTFALGVEVLRGRRALLRARQKRRNSQLAILGAGLVAVAISGLIDVVYTSAFMVVTVFLLAGLTAGVATRAREEDFGAAATEAPKTAALSH